MAERLKIVSRVNVNLRMRRTKLIDKSLYDKAYLALFGRQCIKIELKLVFGLIQLIGSTRPKFDF